MHAHTREEVMSKYNMDSDDVLALRAMWNGDVRIARDDNVLRDMEDPWEDTFPDISRDWPPPESPSVTFQAVSSVKLAEKNKQFVVRRKASFQLSTPSSASEERSCPDSG